MIVGLFCRDLQSANPVVFDPGLEVNTIITNLVTPTTIAFIGANDFLVLEKNTGIVKRVKNGVVQAERESLLFGQDFGVVTNVKTSPDGTLFIVSISDGAVYQIRHR